MYKYVIFLPLFLERYIANSFAIITGRVACKFSEGSDLGSYRGEEVERKSISYLPE